METKTIKEIIIYDLSQLPKGKSVKDIKKDYDEYGLILWDSTLSSHKSGPYVTTIHI